MKKSVLFLLLLFAFGMTANAQKYALIDMEYILKHIPAYSKANEQMEKTSKQYQNEIEALGKQAKEMFQDYQNKAATMTAEQRTQKENEIVAKEKSAADLRTKYFGPKGELAKLRENLMRPIQDQIYNAVKQLSEQYGLTMVIDRASAASIIYASPDIDISNDVLAKLGYSN